MSSAAPFTLPQPASPVHVGNPTRHPIPVAVTVDGGQPRLVATVDPDQAATRDPLDVVADALAAAAEQLRGHAARVRIERWAAGG